MSFGENTFNISNLGDTNTATFDTSNKLSLTTGMPDAPKDKTAIGLFESTYSLGVSDTNETTVNSPSLAFEWPSLFQGPAPPFDLDSSETLEHFQLRDIGNNGSIDKKDRAEGVSQFKDIAETNTLAYNAKLSQAILNELKNREITIEGGERPVQLLVVGGNTEWGRATEQLLAQIIDDYSDGGDTETFVVNNLPQEVYGELLKDPSTYSASVLEDLASRVDKKGDDWVTSDSWTRSWPKEGGWGGLKNTVTIDGDSVKNMGDRLANLYAAGASKIYPGASQEMPTDESLFKSVEQAISDASNNDKKTLVIVSVPIPNAYAAPVDGAKLNSVDEQSPLGKRLAETYGRANMLSIIGAYVGPQPGGDNNSLEIPATAADAVVPVLPYKQ